MLLWNRSRSKYDAYFPIVEKEPIMNLAIRASDGNQRTITV
jgi:hypothetical protein